MAREGPATRKYDRIIFIGSYEKPALTILAGNIFHPERRCDRTNLRITIQLLFFSSVLPILTYLTLRLHGHGTEHTANVLTS